MDWQNGLDMVKKVASPQIAGFMTESRFRIPRLERLLYLSLDRQSVSALLSVRKTVVDRFETSGSHRADFVPADGLLSHPAIF